MVTIPTSIAQCCSRTPCIITRDLGFSSPNAGNIEEIGWKTRTTGGNKDAPWWNGDRIIEEPNGNCGDCTATYISTSMCHAGNHLILDDSSNDATEQKWRFYDDEGIVNVQCGRDMGSLAITEIKENTFENFDLYEDIQFAFVGASGEAISVGDKVSNRIHIELIY